MGKRNNYLTLEQASQMLGKPTSYFMSLISKGELGAKLAGGQWQISVRDFDKIRDSLPPEPEKIVHKAPGAEKVVYDFLTKRSFQKVKQEPKSMPKGNLQGQTALARSSNLVSDNDLKVLDTTVRNLTSQIEIHLAYVAGGKAVWNKVRQDRYKLNSARRGALPEKTVLLLEELQKIKQKYILIRKTHKYKELLLSLPEWDIKRVERMIKQVLRKAQKENGSVPPKTMVEEMPPGHYTGGKIGYYAGPSDKEKRYWWNEED